MTSNIYKKKILTENHHDICKFFYTVETKKEEMEKNQLKFINTF
jgi:hypothetical protein